MDPSPHASPPTNVPAADITGEPAAQPRAAHAGADQPGEWGGNPGTARAGAPAVGETGTQPGVVISGGATYGPVVGVNAGAVSSTYYFADQHYDVGGLPNPYLGLRSFTYTEHARFAGREQSLAAAIQLLTAPGAPRSLLFITGASGSGKSSFAQAGLLPALVAHYARRNLQTGWTVMRPSRYPLAGLQDALAQLHLPAIGGHHAATAEALIGAMRNQTPREQVNLIVLDQFEELFTQSEPPQRDACFGLLEALPAFMDVRTHVIATLRSDYLPELFERETLYELAKQGIELRAMGEAELVEAIQRPLQQYQREGLVSSDKRFEEALVVQLAHDAAGDAAYLPLLQVTLEQLWRTGSLTLSAYSAPDEGGGLARALQQRAEQVYQFQTTPGREQEPRPAADQTTLLDIFLGLVEVAPAADGRRDVRRRRTYEELEHGSAERGQLIAELCDARLLSRTVETQDDAVETDVVDIIHESLIRNWSRLQDAIKAQRHVLQQRVRFAQALHEWRTGQEADTYLLSGVRLAEAQALAERGDIELQDDHARELLRRSIAHRDAARWRQLQRAWQVAAVLAVSLVLGVAATVFAFDQARRATRAASLDRARLFVEQGRRTADERPLLGLRLALEGLTFVPPESAADRPAILQNIVELVEKVRLTRLATDGVSMTTSLDGSMVVLARHKAPSELRQLGDGSHIAELAGGVSQVLASPDGTSVAVTYVDKPGELRRTSDGLVIAELTDKVAGVQFSPDGSVVVVNYPNRHAELRTTVDGALITTLAGEIAQLEFEAPAALLFFTPDGTHFVVSYTDRPSELRRSADGARIAELGDLVTHADFRADGQSFVVSYANARSNELRRADTGALAPLQGQVVGQVAFVRYSPDGMHVIVGYADTPGELRQVVDGRVIAALPDTVDAVQFSPDGATMVLNYPEHRSELRRPADGAVIATLAGSGAAVRFSPDSSGFVVSYTDGRRPEAISAETGSLDQREVVSDILATEQPCSYGYELFDAPGEVRRTVDGARMSALAAANYQANFSPHGTALVLRYASEPDELRWTDHSRVIALPDRLCTVDFTPDGAYVVLNYADARGELRRTDNGDAIVLPGKVGRVTFSPDATAFVVDYTDVRSELWDLIPSPRRLAVLDITKQSSVFIPDGQRLVVQYLGGGVDLLDLAWLRAMNGSPTALAETDLVRLACTIPLRSRLWTATDDDDLRRALAPREPTACR